MKNKIHAFNFHDLETQILEYGYYIADSNLLPETIYDLLEYYSLIEQQSLLRLAKVGQGLSEQKRTQVRNDLIFWIREWNLSPGLMSYYHFLEELRIFLRETFRIPLKRFESHIACYPEGSFYKKHVDQHKWTMHRQFSVILYLSQYKEGNGGELMLYPKRQEALKVLPVQGRIVIYPSKDLAHEVLVSRAKRISITSWMRDDLIFF